MDPFSQTSGTGATDLRELKRRGERIKELEQRDREIQQALTNAQMSAKVAEERVASQQQALKDMRSQLDDSLMRLEGREKGRDTTGVERLRHEMITGFSQIKAAIRKSQGQTEPHNEYASMRRLRDTIEGLRSDVNLLREDVKRRREDDQPRFVPLSTAGEAPAETQRRVALNGPRASYAATLSKLEAPGPHKHPARTPRGRRTTPQSSAAPPIVLSRTQAAEAVQDINTALEKAPSLVLFDLMQRQHHRSATAIVMLERQVRAEAQRRVSHVDGEMSTASFSSNKSSVEHLIASEIIAAVTSGDVAKNTLLHLEQTIPTILDAYHARAEFVSMASSWLCRHVSRSATVASTDDLSTTTRHVARMAAPAIATLGARFVLAYDIVLMAVQTVISSRSAGCTAARAQVANVAASALLGLLSGSVAGPAATPALAELRGTLSFLALHACVVEVLVPPLSGGVDFSATIEELFSAFEWSIFPPCELQKIGTVAFLALSGVQTGAPRRSNRSNLTSLIVDAVMAHRLYAAACLSDESLRVTLLSFAKGSASSSGHVAAVAHCVLDAKISLAEEPRLAAFLHDALARASSATVEAQLVAALALLGGSAETGERGRDELAEYRRTAAQWAVRALKSKRTLAGRLIRTTSGVRLWTLALNFLDET